MKKLLQRTILAIALGAGFGSLLAWAQSIGPSPVTAIGVAQNSVTAGQVGPLSQGAVTTAAPSYTSGRTDPLSLTTAGELRVLATQNTSPWVVNETQLGGQAINLGNGTTGTGTQRVTISSDSTGTVSVTQGTSPWVSNVTQWNGTTAVTGSGTATGALRVELPTNGTGVVGLNAGTATIGALNPLTGTLTNRSGTITSGGVSQTLAASNASRRYLLIQNPCSASSQGIATAESLFINFTSAASATSASVELAPCGSYTTEAGPVTTELITVLGATTAHAFTAKEM